MHLLWGCIVEILRQETHCFFWETFPLLFRNISQTRSAHIAAASTAAFWHHIVVRWAVLLIWDRTAEGNVERGRIMLTWTVWTIPAVRSTASSQVNKIWSAPECVALSGAVRVKIRHIFASLNRAVACPVLLSPQTAVRALFVHLLPSKGSIRRNGKVVKTTIGFLMSVCLSTHKNSPPTGRIFVKFYVEYY